MLAFIAMYGLSYLWHGVLFSDLRDLKIPFGLYLSLAALVYAIISAGITVAVNQAIVHEWIKLKAGFPFMSFLVGAVIGFVVYLFVLVLGLSFAESGMVHVVVDVLWQMLEQGVGGLMVSLGVILDLRWNFLEVEKAK